MPSKSLLYLLVLLPLVACASAPPFNARAVAMEWATYMQRDYSLRPGDRLAVQVSQVGQDETSSDLVQEVVVSPTGSIDLQRLPAPVQVGGRSVAAVRTQVLQAYQQEFTSPRVSLSLVEAAAQSVYVLGEVSASGAIAYQPGMTMTMAIAAAGSFAITVKENDVRVLRVSPNGSQRTFRVNLSAVLRDEQPDFLLLPGDVIYCQTSTIADMGNMVELYIRRLLPFSITGVSVGN